MSLPSRLALMHHCLNFIRCYQDAGGHMVPKFHGMMHLTREVIRSGSPAYKSTYTDEHENGVVKLVGESAHRCTWTRSIFEKLEVMEELTRIIHERSQ